MRISDWSSDVCSSDLGGGAQRYPLQPQQRERGEAEHRERDEHFDQSEAVFGGTPTKSEAVFGGTPARREAAITHRSSPCRRRRRSPRRAHRYARSEEHTSELQSLMRISYAVFCLKQKKKHN